MNENLRVVELAWRGGMRFEGGVPGGPPVMVDADLGAGPGPMHQLLMAVAACSGADVVSILEKMRVSLRDLRIEVRGTRRAEIPRRYVDIHLTYRLAGAGLDEAKARRAIDLSIERYCSAIHSLAPDIPISYDVVLGASGEAKAAS
jgi:putative redox protein